MTIVFCHIKDVSADIMHGKINVSECAKQHLLTFNSSYINMYAVRIKNNVLDMILKIIDYCNDVPVYEILWADKNLRENYTNIALRYANKN